MINLRSALLFTVILLVSIHSGQALAAKCYSRACHSAVIIYNQPGVEQVDFTLDSLDARCRVFQMNPTMFSASVFNCYCIDVNPQTGEGNACAYSKTYIFNPDQPIADRISIHSGCDFEKPYSNPPDNCYLRQDSCNTNLVTVVELN